MSRERSGDDIQLEPPLARHADTQPAVEDRSYIVFFAGALVMALGGGFLLAVLVSLVLSGTIDFPQDGTRLTQAHGWAQLQGWAGLFVAGMALRLMPRFAGRKPLPARLNVAVFVLLFSGAAVRAAAQSSGDERTAGTFILAASLLFAAGAATVAAALAVTFVLGRKRDEAWRYFAWAGAGWWAVWAALTIKAGVEARDHAFVPPPLDEAMTWGVMLGAIGNFVWAVQSRSVPVFFGRRPPSPRTLAVPGIALNAGAALVVLAWLIDNDVPSVRLTSAGLALAGIGLAWLAPVAGSAWGRATRLRPRARAASRYVLAANVATVLAGLLLLTTGAASLATGELEWAGFRDAARHAIGLGMITALIFGMAQLVAPVFALERAEARAPSLVDRAAWWAIIAAIVLRVLAGLLAGDLSLEGRMHLSAAAGTLAWIAVAAFALSVFRAVRKEPAMRELLAAPVRQS
ncbi:MAG: hypothetical protein Kow0010_04920 [Dehalococcoidia bacterium]